MKRALPMSITSVRTLRRNSEETFDLILVHRTKIMLIKITGDHLDQWRKVKGCGAGGA